MYLSTIPTNSSNVSSEAAAAATSYWFKGKKKVVRSKPRQVVGQSLQLQQKNHRTNPVGFTFEVMNFRLQCFPPSGCPLCFHWPGTALRRREKQIDMEEGGLPMVRGIHLKQFVSFKMGIPRTKHSHYMTSIIHSLEQNNWKYPHKLEVVSCDEESEEFSYRKTGTSYQVLVILETSE